MNYISELINKYLKGRHNAETEAKVRRWLVDEKNREEKEQALREYWENINPECDLGSRSESQQEAHSKAHQSLQKVKKRLGMKPGKKISFPGWLRVAAVLMPLLVITGITYRYMNKPVSVTEIIVPYGERKQVTLPDGSEVWLSAGSTLEYPGRFTGDRIVRLSGEAYFSVRKDPSKAFVVETRFQTVRVLGTGFMVTAYPDEDQSTTALVSGKVQVSFSGQSFVLSPGRQITLDHHTSETKASRVLADDILSRRSGRLIFNHATLPEILRAVERQYKVKIQASGLSGDSFSVRFVHDETFEQVMNVLGDLSGGFEWTRQIEN